MLQNPLASSQGRKLLIRIRDDGTSRGIAFGSAYRPMIAPLPTSTTAGKLLYLGFIYDAGDQMWDLVAISQQS